MSASASSAPPLLPAVWKLLLLRLRINWNGFKHARTRTKVLTILAVFGLLAFAAGIFLVSWLLLGRNWPNSDCRPRSCLPEPIGAISQRCDESTSRGSHN